MKSKIVLPPNHLKQKVGNGGFDPRAVEKADRAIENNNIDFEPLALDAVTELSRILDSPESRNRAIADIVREGLFPIMQLNAHGSMFRYKSVSRVSLTVTDFLEAVTVFDVAVLQIMRVYRDTVRALIALKIKNEKDPACDALARAFEDVCARYIRKIDQA